MAAFRDRMRSLFFIREPDPGDLMTAVRSATGSMYASGGAAQAVPIISFNTKSGTSASDAVTQNPLMFSPVWRISLALGKLPLKVYRIDETNGERMEARDHPAYLLLRAPNPVMRRNLLIAGTVASMFQYGRVGWYKNRKVVKGSRASGKVGPPPVELWPIPGNLLFPIRDKDSILSGYEIRSSGGVTKLALEDVCYFRLVPSPDDWAAGMSPMTALAQASDYGSEAIDAATDFFRNALLSRQWLDIGTKILETPARLRLQAQLQIAREDRYAVPILEDGAQLRDMGHGPNDLVLIRAVQNAMEIISMAFGLPADQKDLPFFYGEVVTPIADAIEQELERSLFDLDYLSDPAFAEFQFREILAGDPLQRAQLHQTKILSMQETPDEARMAENEAPLGTPESQSLWGPLNAQPISALAAGGERPKKNSAGGQGGNQGKGAPTAQPSPGGTNSNAPPGPKSVAATASGDFRARFAPSWGVIRSTAITGRAEAARRQMQGQLKNELKALRARLRTSEKGVRVDQLPWPTPGELSGVMQDYERAATETLQAFMAAVGDDAWREAASLYQDRTNAEWDVPPQPEQVVESFRIRAAQVADAFAGDRANEVERLLGDFRARPDMGVRDFDSALHETYQTFSTRMAGIASTELSWAFEQTSIGAWLQAGVRSFDYIYDGGPCTTGVCESAAEQDHVLGEELENVGASFTGARFAPLHPGCGCYVIPRPGAITNPAPAGVASQVEGG